MRATPRVDALMDIKSPIGFNGPAMVDLARELERELTLLREQKKEELIVAGLSTQDVLIAALEQYTAGLGTQSRTLQRFGEHDDLVASLEHARSAADEILKALYSR